MKLRMRGDSLRFRLTKIEVNALRDQGWWQEVTTLDTTGNSRLVYRIESASVEKATVRFVGAVETVITVELPAIDVVRWAGDTQVGLYFEESWGLKVAIEKDFRCLDPRRDEDESDNYDNPNVGESAHTECHAES